MKRSIAAILLTTLAALPLWAVITAPTTLKSKIVSVPQIFIAKIDTIDPAKPTMSLKHVEDLKGKATYLKIAVSLKGDEEAEKDKHVPQLLKRLAADMPMVMFVIQRGKVLNVFTYSNGTWMQMVGQVTGDDTAVLRLLHGEPYLRRTFKGTTEEMKKVILDSVQGKSEPPPVDEKETPGFGPEVPMKQGMLRAPDFFRPGAFEHDADALNPLNVCKHDRPSSHVIGGRGDGGEGGLHPASRHALVAIVRPTPTNSPLTPVPSPSADISSAKDTGPSAEGEGRSRSHGASASLFLGQPFAVIPTVVVGGPFLILGILFPAVFGGMFVLFRQWTAFLTVLSVNSILVMLHYFFAPTLFRGSWWISDQALWLVLTLVVFLGTMWAWRRQLLQFFLGADAVDTPERTERVVLLMLSATCAAALGVTLWLQQGKFDVNSYLVLAIGAGIWIATIYKFVRRIFVTELPMTTEGIMLGGSLLVHLVVLGVYLMQGGGSVQGDVVQGTGGAPSAIPQFKGSGWEENFTTVENGGFVSSPIVHEGRVYAASAHPAVKFGYVFCIDAKSGKKVWEFLDDGELKQVFSTPTIAGDKLYIGEGFHDDANCKLYCLELTKGDKLWHFKTTSQTEAKPAVANGKVYMGCGNDGFFCIDSATGKALWQYPERGAKSRLLRFGAGAAVKGDRVYVGTGVDRNQKDDKGETAVLCLDAKSGALLWKQPVDLPVWSEPVLAGEQLFVALGNGDVASDDPFNPAGRLLCLDPTDGKIVWKLDVPNGVLEAPSVDAYHVYFGSRDGNCYCVGRHSGKIRWQAALGSPVLATPVIAPCEFGETESVFAVGSAGKVSCLDPRTGAVFWTYDVSKQGLRLDTKPALIIEQTEQGRVRRLFLGAGDLAGNTKATLICLEDVIK